MFPSFWLGQRVLATADAGIEASLGDPNVLRAVLGGALYVAACGLLGFALGALLRHTAGAITVAIGIVFILPIVANFLPGTWGDNVGKVLNAGGAISNTRHIDGQLDPWTGYAVFSLWWIVLLAVAADPDAPPRRLTRPPPRVDRPRCTGGRSAGLHALRTVRQHAERGRFPRVPGSWRTRDAGRQDCGRASRAS